jgi:hypothetical protein
MTPTNFNQINTLLAGDSHATRDGAIHMGVTACAPTSTYTIFERFSSPPPPTPPHASLTPQYSNVTHVQKLHNVFTEVFLVQICQKLRKIHSEVCIQGKKLRKTRSEF